MFLTFYYSSIFILSLFLCGRLFSGQYLLEGTEPYIKRRYVTCCSAFVIMCLLIVGSGVSTSADLDKVFLYLIEFFRMGILINGAELCAVITNRKASDSRTVNVVTSELFYLGVTTLIIRTVFDDTEIKHGIFGVQFVMGNNFGTVLYIIFHVLVLFFYGAYIYLFYYSCTKKRELYIFRRCMRIVAVLSISLFIEAFCIIRFNEYIPVMVLGIIISLSIFKRLLLYRRKIEYNEGDYTTILSPTYETPAFVCDDQGIVIFENTRAFVMRQMYKDSYKGNYLSDLFEMTLYDMERLRNPKLSEPFEIFCNYRKEANEVKLTVRHNIDRYAEIFSTEVEVTLVDENEKSRLESLESKKRYKLADLTHEELNSLRIDSLVNLISFQKKLYEEEEQILFSINLMGIEKMSEVLGIYALGDLCVQIRDELNAGSAWESLEGLMIDIDRQHETLKLLL